MDNHRINPHTNYNVAKSKNEIGVGVKGIIFDLGNVLINFDHTIAAKRISRFCTKTPVQIYELFFDSSLTGLFEEGKIGPEEFFLRVKEMLGAELDYAGFLPIWNEIFFMTPGNKAVYRLAKELKKSYQTVLLSNVNVLHFEYVKNNFPLLDAFHQVVTSFEAGYRKPHPAIYEQAINLLGGAPSPAQVFYTDDRSDLIEEANKMGIRGFVFKDIKKLKSDLENTGVIF